MAFASFGFFLFLPAVFFLFLLTPNRWRWGVLLAASLAFYAVQGVPYLLAVLAYIILISFAAGIWLGADISARNKSRLLAGGVILLLAPLLFLRYIPILLAQFSPTAGVAPGIWVTIGVSFYTFQAISYLVDIYLELLTPEKHLGYFALYLSFFPKLIQGPIERGADLLPQIRQPAVLRYKALMYGLLQMTWGMVLKLVISDRLGTLVDPVYNNAHQYTGWPLIVATYLYALQIYFDFAGYTQIALGAARLFGIQLTNNFNSPYLATSVADFWRRWHISFSRWILDYIFKPLQMQWRSWKTWGSAVALLITFLVSGLWHGARWGYLVWGLLHGLYMAVAVFTMPAEKKWLKKMGWTRSRWVKVAQIFVTFNLVAFAWIFFRAASLSDGLYIASHLFTGLLPGSMAQAPEFIRQNLLLGQSARSIALTGGLLLLIAGVSIFWQRITGWISGPFLAFVWGKRTWFSLQLVAVTLGVIVLVLVMTAQNSNPFIYTVF